MANDFALLVDGTPRSRHRTRALAHATGRIYCDGHGRTETLTVTGPDAIVPGGEEPLSQSPSSAASADHREGDGTWRRLTGDAGDLVLDTRYVLPSAEVAS